VAKIKILIADNSFLIREGFRSVINSNADFKLTGEAEKPEELAVKLTQLNPDVLVIDYASLYFCLDDIAVIHQQFPHVHILAVTNPQVRSTISKAIENGVVSHLLKDCGKDEISEAIYFTSKGEKFLCGKIVDTLLKEKDISITKTSSRVSCEGIKLSNREIEIIRLVAKGMSNKEIAEKIFLSVHTITTHRKNIMSKLGVNNTAGLVMFAVRQKLIEETSLLFNSN
jgi:DNA-binding NarL/FixJ family response regulator